MHKFISFNKVNVENNTKQNSRNLKYPNVKFLFDGINEHINV